MAKPEDAKPEVPNPDAATVVSEKPAQVGGKKKDENKEAIINPDLDEELLDSLINSARKLIVNLYITCENDFMEAIHIFEAIVAIQLAKTTNSQINILNNLYLEYLAEHKEESQA